jgi:hypothetical protein
LRQAEASDGCGSRDFLSSAPGVAVGMIVAGKKKVAGLAKQF